MPSITSWSRIEPVGAGDDVAAGLAARIADPLWLLARQWQVGEFQAEDGGTPIVARWRGDVAAPDPLPPRPDPAGHAAAGAALRPGDVSRSRCSSSASRSASRRADTPTAEGLRLGVESGQHFLRLLGRPVDDAGLPAGVHPDVRRSPAAGRPGGPARRRPAWATCGSSPAGRSTADGSRGRAGRARRARHRDARSRPATPPRCAPPARRGGPGSTSCSAGRIADEQAWQRDRMEYAFSIATRLDPRPVRRVDADGQPVRRRRARLVQLRPQRRGQRRHHARPRSARSLTRTVAAGTGDAAGHAGAPVLGDRGRPARPRRAAARRHRSAAAADDRDDQRLRQRLVRHRDRPAHRVAGAAPGRWSSSTRSASRRCCGPTVIRRRRRARRGACSSWRCRSRRVPRAWR